MKSWRVTGIDKRGKRIAYLCYARTGREAIIKAKSCFWWKSFGSPKCSAKIDKDNGLSLTYVIVNECSALPNEWMFTHE